MGEILDVTTETFDRDVLQSQTPVVVDFWATWCGPCRQLAPTLKAVAEQFKGQVRVAKVDIDSNPELTQRFRIQGVPTLLFVKEGQIKGSLVGNQSKSVLERKVQELI